MTITSTTLLRAAAGAAVLVAGLLFTGVQLGPHPDATSMRDQPAVEPGRHRVRPLGDGSMLAR